MFKTICSLSLLLIACKQPPSNSLVIPFSSGKWTDLTYEFSEETLYWPTAETFHLDNAYVVALPMKIKGGSGAPLRIVAWLEN